MNPRTALRALLLSLAISVPAFAANRTNWVNGITEPILEVSLSSPVQGIVSSRPLKEGDSVKKNQMVLELDRQLETLEVERKKAVAEQLRSESETLHDLDRKSLSVIKQDIFKKDAELRVAIAEQNLAQEQLRRRQLFAPFDGTVVEIFKQEGESCQPNERLLRLVDVHECYFVANLEAKAGYPLQLGQTVKLEVDSGNTTASVNGKISYISPVVDAASGLLKIKAIFENPQGKIRPGVAARMQVEGGNAN